MKSIVVRLLMLLLGFGGVQAASAQPFPSKPVRIIAPFSAGGLVDVLARGLAAPMSDSIGQPVVVENRPGGSSLIGMVACAKAPADGYTVCMTTAESLSYNPHVFRNLPYDPDRDFAPVINLARSSSMLFAKAGAPFNTFKEMIAYAKANPGKLNWGTWGPGTIPDVYLHWITHQTGTRIVAVPYKGSGQAIPALIAGEVDVTYQSISVVIPLVKGGKAKSIAVVGDRRSPLIPEVPSLGEEGADPGLRSYFGVFAPGGTPKPVVDRLHAEFAKAVHSPRGQEFLRNRTLDVVADSPEDFARFLKEDRVNSGKVFQTIGIRPSDAPS